MRLADDRRGRVPFALVGVVLLVTSASLAVSLRTGPPEPDDGAVAAAMEEVTTETWTAVRRAAERAGRRAARSPVVAPAGTPAGAVLNNSTPFRDYLRLRIYSAVREELRHVAAVEGSVRANATLPRTPDPAALRAAKRRVSVSAVDNGTALRVVVEGVAVRASRDGRVVERANRTVSLVAATPVLALHRRVERYERRLDGGPLSGPGLGRRLTARLYAMAWARGYAQYGGAPIENVVANRHVEVAANGGIVGVQRAVFGRSDPATRRALRRATLATGVTDLLVGVGHRGREWTRTVLDGTTGGPPVGSVPDRGPLAAGPSPESRLRVGVNATADRAFRALVAGAGDGPSLNGTVAAAYAAEARLAVDVRTVRAGERPEPSPPPGEWRLVGEETERTVRVEDAPARAPPVPDGWHSLRQFTRRVEVERTVVREWQRGNETRITRARWSDRYLVSGAVVGRHAPPPTAPDRPVDGVHEPGGPLDGPNLADVPDAAIERLVDRRGGVDAVARRAATDRLDTGPVIVRGERPAGLRGWLYADLVALRERVANVSVTVPRGAVGTDPARAPDALADAVRARRTALVDTPERYDGVADAAQVAARAAYLDRVVAALEARADGGADRRGALAGALASVGGPSPDRLAALVEVSDEVSHPDRRPVLAEGPAGNVSIAVDASPAYLPVSRVTAERVPTTTAAGYHPLAARNVNVFTIPYGRVAAGFADSVVGRPDRAGLGTAGRSLLAANRTVAIRDNRTLARRRAALREAVAASVADVRDRLVATLAGTTDLDAAVRRAVVADGFDRWPTTARRALAAANGSAARAVASVAAEQAGLPPGPDRDWLRLRLRGDLRRAVANTTVPSSLVNRTAATTRAVKHAAVRAAAEEGLGRGVDGIRRRWGGESGRWVPAGLPVAPVPGYWYATVNVWQVSVRGQYARFAVTARQGPPGGLRPSVTYVRDGEAVSLDVTGDGTPERLGRAAEVSFRTGTTVLVVVPPNGRGVGDVDGTADERSPGWSGR